MRPADGISDNNGLGTTWVEVKLIYVMHNTPSKARQKGWEMIYVTSFTFGKPTIRITDNCTIMSETLPEGNLNKERFVLQAICV